MNFYQIILATLVINYIFKKNNQLIIIYRTSALRSSQNSLHSMNTQRPSSAYYPPPVGNPNRPNNLHQSIPNLKSPPSVHRLHNDDSRSGSYPSVNSRPDERTAHYPQNYPGQEIKHQHYPSSPHIVGNQYGQPSYQSPMQNQAYSPGSHNPHMPNGQRGHEEVQRHPSNDIRYQQNLMREDVFRQSQQGRMQDEIRMNNGNMRNDDRSDGAMRVNQLRQEEMLRYPSNSNIKSENHARMNEEMRQGNDIIRNSEIVRTGDMMRTSKSEDMLRQHTRDEMTRYNSTNNIRSPEDNKTDDRQYAHKQIDDIRQSTVSRPEELIRQNTNKNPDEIVRQHPINASLRGQAKMAEMSEEVRRRQNRGYPNTSTYQQYQPPNNNYYQQSQPYQQQQYYQNQSYNQQYQQPMSPSYIQSSNAYNHQTPTSTNPRGYQNASNQQVAQAQSAMQNLNLNTSYQSSITSPNYNYNYSGPMSPQGYPSKLPPTAPKPNRKIEDIPPELPPSSTHPLYAASLQEPPKGAFYPNPTVQGKVGPANPWEREEREKVKKN